jgi:amino acid adenylation domain-containing protein
MNKPNDAPSPRLTPVDYDPFADTALVSTAPTTEAQKEIWVAAQIGGDEANASYNESISLRLHGGLNVQALRDAVQGVIARHDALRSAFSPDGGTLCVAASGAIEVPLVDLSAADEADRQRAFQDVLDRAVEDPFDLVRGPLLRVQVVRLGPKDHQVIITAHHIVCDGWSTDVIVRDMAALYTAAVTGQGASVEPAFSFCEYARMESEESAGEPYREAEAFWRRQYAEMPPALEIPTDRPRPAVKTYSGSRVDIVLKPEVAEKLRRVGRETGCTFVNVLLGSFSVFIHRLTGQEAIPIGLPAAGQAAIGQPMLVGHCVNLLPLLSRVKGDMPFADYLKAVRAVILDAQEHRQMTFGTIVRTLGVRRDPGRVPLVPVVFNIDKGIDVEAIRFHGLTFEFISHPRRFENFEFFLNAVDYRGKVTFECSYNTDLMDEETVRRRMAEFETLLAGAAEDPRQAIHGLPILPADEKKRLLVDWNATDADFPRDRCVHEVFEAQAARAPDALAVAAGSQRLTYGELDRRANRLARVLQQHGAGPDACIAVHMPGSPDMVTALLAVLKAGAAYVPIDPAYPPDRVDYMLRNSGARALVTLKALEAVTAKVALPRLRLDADQDQVAGQDDSPLPHRAAPSNLAYVIYTSGSTGRPKGVAIEHRSLMNLVTWHCRTYGVGPADRATQFAGVAFDATVWELWPYLASGASLHIPDERTRVSTSAIAQWLSAAGITIGFLPTPLAEAVMKEKWPAGTALKVLLTGGERLHRGVASGLAFRLVNHYGPTESTVVTSYAEVDPEESRDVEPPIGRPIANTRVYLLDRRLAPVPIGVAAELFVGGTGLARGYVNAPELTAKAFVEADPGDGVTRRLYRTGDLCRYRRDGRLDFIGRIDTQVKIRGNRVEIGEIEAVLAEHEAVAQCAVAAREDRPGDQKLVCYVVARAGQRVTMTALRKHLRQRLPDYMIPNYLVEMNAIPLTESGKTDYRNLPSPLSAGTGEKVERVLPSTPTEKALAAIWREEIGGGEVGANDNFFDLGGHSLACMKAVARLEERTGVRLRPNVMLMNSLRQIAAQIDDASASLRRS